MSYYTELLVTPETIKTIKEIGLACAPKEACGIMFPDGKVIQLNNLSDEPKDSYALNPQHILEACKTWLEALPTSVTKIDLLVWHTHPGGLVGPSRGDLRQKARDIRYLVVTLPNGEACQY